MPAARWCIALIAICLLAAPAWGTWIWRGGEWTYVPDDEAAPPAPPPKPSEEDRPAPEPLRPTPAPEEPAERAPERAVETRPGEAPRPMPSAEAPPPAARPSPTKVPAAAPRPGTPPPAPPAQAPPPPESPGRARSTGADARLFEEARRALEAGRHGSAESALKTLIKRHPDSEHRAEAMWLRAEALFAMKEYYKAFEQYEALLKDYAGSPHYRDALLREMEIAELYLGPTRRRVLGLPLLSGESEAIEILRRVYEHQPLGDLADDVVLRIADYYWNKGRWEDAEQYYDQYCRQFPNGDAIRRAELQRAKCAIERCPDPRYDMAGLRLAYDRLAQFEAKYPEAAREENVPALKQAIRERQAESLYRVAEHYRRRGQPAAAAFCAERVQKEFADTSWSEKARQLAAVMSAPPR